MKVSPAGRDLIKSFEAYRPHAYLCQAGVWTCGWGHTRGVKPSTVCTREQAEAWLTADLAPCEAGVDGMITVPLTQGQFDALTSLVFNVGLAAVKRSTLPGKINGGAPQEVIRDCLLSFCKYRNRQGVLCVSQGLLNRRKREAALYFGGAV